MKVEFRNRLDLLSAGEPFEYEEFSLLKFWQIVVGHSTVGATEVAKIKSKLLPRLAILLGCRCGAYGGCSDPLCQTLSGSPACHDLT